MLIFERIANIDHVDGVKITTTKTALGSILHWLSPKSVFLFNLHFRHLAQLNEFCNTLLLKLNYAIQVLANGEIMG